MAIAVLRRGHEIVLFEIRLLIQEGLLEVCLGKDEHVLFDRVCEVDHVEVDFRRVLWSW
jgi:hypothetical protein